LPTPQSLIIRPVTTIFIAFFAFWALSVNPPAWVLLAGAATTITSHLSGYLLNKMRISPELEYIAASIGKGFLGSLLAHLIDLVAVTFAPTSAALFIFGFLVALEETVLHPYLINSK